MGSALHPQETHNTDTGCLSPDDLGDPAFCSRGAPGNPTLPTSRATSFLPPWNHPLPHPSVPPGLPHCRHSATRACRPHVHGYGLFPRWHENLATTCPSFRLRCSVLEPTRHMARTRAPDRHAKILPEPFTLPRALAGPRPAQSLNKA